MLIDEVDGVSESAVIGLAHTDFGEAVTAVVVLDTGVLTAGETAEESTVEQAIVNHLETSLARFKQPKKYIFVEELPRNTMGKVQKNLLREDYLTLYS